MHFRKSTQSCSSIWPSQIIFRSIVGVRTLPWSFSRSIWVSPSINLTILSLVCTVPPAHLLRRCWPRSWPQRRRPLPWRCPSPSSWAKEEPCLKQRNVITQRPGQRNDSKILKQVTPLPLRYFFLLDWYWFLFTLSWFWFPSVSQSRHGPAASPAPEPAVCYVQCAVCSVQCAVCSVQCAVCQVKCARWSAELYVQHSGFEAK